MRPDARKPLPCTRVVPALCALVAVMLSTESVRADPAGMKVLRAVEHSYGNFKDQVIKYKFIIRDRSGDKTVKFTLYNLPGWKRLLKFTYPGDVRGQMFLILSETEMYVYLPAYKRVRRVAGHVKNQGFMGSDFTFDDMAIGSWSHQYVAKLVRQDPKYWYLYLTPKRGRRPIFPKLRMRVIKRIRQADRIVFLSGSGRLLRTQTFINWKCQSGDTLCVPKHVRMVDHRRGNHTTDLYALKVRQNVGVPKRKFTLRYLARGS